MNEKGAVILCGGKSSRMGRSKALLPFGNEVMLQRVVRLVSEVIAIENIVVVAAAGQELPKLPSGINIAYDAQPERGPLEGLAAGLRTLTNKVEVVFATSCDVPLLMPQLVEQLFALLGDHEIVVPKEGKFYHPLTAVYRTIVLQQIQALLDADRLRPVFLFDQVKTLELPIEKLRTVDAELLSFLNCNHEEDYQKALAKLKG